MKLLHFYIYTRWFWKIWLVIFLVNVLPAQRRTISLNGGWDMTEGLTDQIPTQFINRVEVPGLLDQSRHAFEDIGQKSNKREVFWYRRYFKIEGEMPEVAILKFHKVKYGVQVFLNGHLVGENFSCFVPVYFNVGDYLRDNGEQNVIHVRVGAFPDRVPATVPWGHDYEKIRYIPGIYDDVELILAGTPYIANIQTVPDINKHVIRIVSRLENQGTAKTIRLNYTVREVLSGKTVATQQGSDILIPASGSREVDIQIPLKSCRLWTPEDPFLYELEVKTSDDQLHTRFGMRTFSFDPETRRAVLNGKPYFMRGTNICIYRFFEDSERGTKPWDDYWVRTLHRKFKSMHWNSMRYCIGFPPEKWYRIADEVGFLIQDEFPLWGKPEDLRNEVLIEEYTKWMEERWNHPCVVIWDAQNETITQETGKAIQGVRDLDLSGRPWENGWSPPQAETDPIETHPYLFSRYRRTPPAGEGPLAELLDGPVLMPFNGPERSSPEKNFYSHPIIINEYGWLWLNRDGSPTTLTDQIYTYLVGPNATPEQRFEIYARYLAALTEYWRSHRKCAAVMHFCGLAYSRTGQPRGQTCDHFVNLDFLEYEANFWKYVRDAFSPVGIMINRWENRFPASSELEVPVFVINDLYQDWQGTVTLKILSQDEGVSLQEKNVKLQVAALGRSETTFRITLPQQSGKYRFVAEIQGIESDIVQSLRDFEIIQPD
jgi:beta-galactosidase